MYRCALAALAVAASIAPAAAQVQRNFPQTALRGTIAIGLPPDIQLNGRDARLGPGARIRGQNNLLQMSAALSGQKFVVNYTVDTLGLVHDVWILRPEEVAVRPWPVNVEQAAAWSFDPVAQTWSKP